MGKLAIRGHKTRGKEVIEILKMLGGDNQNSVYSGKDTFHYYFIDNETGDIRTKLYTDDCWTKLTYNIFTLEEFLKKFPYKVGDKVCFPDDLSTPFTINKMWWDENANELLCSFIEDDIEVPVVGIRTYKEKSIDNTNKVIFEANAQCCDIMNDIIKEETMKEKLEQITLDIPNGYEFFGIDDNNKIVLTKKQLQYPKTYEECCEILSIPFILQVKKYSTYEHNYHEYTTSKKLCLLQDNLNRLGKLLICRDAYWKIVGDWRPEFRFGKKKHCIMTKDNKVISATVEETNRIFVFPTEEMRDAFFGNFKKELEECKEFL